MPVHDLRSIRASYCTEAQSGTGHVMQDKMNQSDDQIIPYSGAKQRTLSTGTIFPIIEVIYGNIRRKCYRIPLVALPARKREFKYRSPQKQAANRSPMMLHRKKNEWNRPLTFDLTNTRLVQMNFSSTASSKAYHLFIISFTFVSVSHSARARPSSTQDNQYSQLLVMATTKRMTRSCDPLPLSPETWNDLELDTYLEYYPNGDKITLADYAASKNASNFVCGIGSICDAGQMCYPVTDQDWYILFALQQWNSVNNMLFLGIGYAISIVQASVNSLLSTIFPAVDASGAIHAKQSMAISAGMMEVSGTLMMDVMILMESETGPVGWTLNVVNFGMAAGFALWAYKMKTPDKPIEEGFQVWTDIVYQLSGVQEEAHNAISAAVKKAINSPISSKDGIYGVLKGGHYLNPSKVLSIPDIADKLRKVILAMSMNLMFRTMNTFITLGKDDCTDQGENGAWPQKDKLAYCPQKGGPMYSLLRVTGNTDDSRIPNANVINEIFGFSTKLIMENSWNCQQNTKNSTIIPIPKANSRRQKTMTAFSTYQCAIVDNQLQWTFPADFRAYEEAYRLWGMRLSASPKESGLIDFTDFAMGLFSKNLLSILDSNNPVEVELSVFLVKSKFNRLYSQMSSGILIMISNKVSKGD
ncbi:hypothetical protein H4Q26_008715 [Puccinia striiformis f. sp. tritici PST-130]|nr:hypothetical protein H4Q26_008715 [Puccinia striiformis f. sp. tritici PST-130]